MKRSYEILGYDTIRENLADLANSMEAKTMLLNMEPLLSEQQLQKQLRDTTQARQMIDNTGLPPIPSMDGVKDLVEKTVRGECLTPEEAERIGFFLTAVRRLKDYLRRGKQLQISLAYYEENLKEMKELAELIERTVRGGRVDDYASVTLRDIRRELVLLEEKMNAKAENLMKTQKAALAESFLVKRNGRLCLPVKKDWKSRIPGMVIDKSSTGSTFFIEPEAVARLREEWEIQKIEEDNEERRILYEIAGHVAEQEELFKEDIRVMINLDFMFAKGKLSAEMEAIEPEINTERRTILKNARHPMIARDECVPLNLSFGTEQRGVIITGPNTGGKTVAIKTVGLLNLMACSGLHVPCDQADICMNSQVLCDIGDGQNMADNLSTFSAHITNIIDILKRVNRDSLVILDELGSGTDPAEGMGIAIAILEELRLSGCLFLATTHYPEVKTYALGHGEIANARMAFDRKNLRPMYKLEVGLTGESCALYIARRLGMPDTMIAMAAKEAYGENSAGLVKELLPEGEAELKLQKLPAPKITKHNEVAGRLREAAAGFTRGDSVMVTPGDLIGIVVKPANEQGEVLVQIHGQKQLVNHRRLKLKVGAAELYPEDYDFSIVFDSVENRKARHKMDRKYEEGLVVRIEE